MNTLRRLRKFWIPAVATMVLGCFSDASAQIRYKITDLGINNSKDNFSMAMGLNNQGWAENMDGFVNPPENNMGTTVFQTVIASTESTSTWARPGKPGANS